MSVNLASERNLLLPGLMEVTGQYDLIPKQYPRYMDKRTSMLNQERVAEERYLGLAALKNQGAPVEFDNASGDRYVYNITPAVIALGYAITQEAIEDNLYKSQFNPTNLGLQNSFNQTKEILAANVLNTGTTYNSAVVGDGKAMCATDHPVEGNTYQNRPSVDLDLNESALETAAIQIRYFLDQAGMRIMARPQKLLVPPQLRYTAIRLMETELRPGTANNDINAVRYTGEYAGFEVLDFLTSQYAWFVKTTIPGGVWLERAPFDIDMQVDFITKSLLVTGRERYAMSYYDPRWCWGSFPTS
jgi:hypothetical protein